MLLQDDDAEKINHRIPHRFEPITNIGANWCCHCGYMLPLGRKNARKCTECDITCHANCAHLVPDFCGMSMETANQLLRDWRDINKARGGKTVTQSRQQTQYAQQLRSSIPSEPQLDQLRDDMDHMKVVEPPVPQKDVSYGRQQMQTPPPDMAGQPGAYPSQSSRQQPGGRTPATPAFSPEASPQQTLPGRPVPGGYESHDPYGYQVRCCGSALNPPNDTKIYRRRQHSKRFLRRMRSPLTLEGLLSRNGRPRYLLHNKYNKSRNNNPASPRVSARSVWTTSTFWLCSEKVTSEKSC